MVIPSITIFARHSEGCRYRDDETWRRCNCRKHLRWTYNGKQFRQSAKTRSWQQAEDRKRELEDKFKAGQPGAVPAVSHTNQPTISQAVQIFITAKEGEGCSQPTVRKLRYQLGTLENFLAARSKLFPSEITATDLIEYRASWTWKSGVTRQKAQQNVRGFLRSCCKENLPDLLAALKTIRLSKTDVARLEPQPFSEQELKKLLAQVPITFAKDPTKASRMTALIHFMVSTGLAIRDTVQLEREHIADGWLRIRRQKTNRPVEQKLDSGLYRELLTVANSSPKYIFWNGTSQPMSATGLWQTDLRELMDDAGLWIKGNLSHRFRDTAVDFWIGSGCSIVEVAAMLGDTVPIVEKHYRKLMSKRLQERLAKVPTRSWSANA
ncbi:MAG TPA: tyrosine-type recombinase/integrase [Terriglobales bacterium]|nr:tyrosine-type recombinase/integrase [Terriglobales bacterium]